MIGERRGHHHHAHDTPVGGDRLRTNQHRLAWMLALALGWAALEVAGGMLSNSLALIADAGHMMSDSAALALALFATWIARRPPTVRNSFGYRRTEILGALANGAALVVVSLWIVVEAVGRLGVPPEIDASLMAWIAAGGLVVNLAGLVILHDGAHHDLNLRGAWLHVLGDTLGSLAVLAAAFAAWSLGWRWVDPAVSIVVAVLVLFSAWSLLREAVSILMEAAPGHIDPEEVRRTILGVPGVLGMHRLHVWMIGSGVVAMSAHVVIVRNESFARILGEVRQALHDRFSVEHLTIQPEPEGAALDCCRHDPRDWHSPPLALGAAPGKPA